MVPVAIVGCGRIAGGGDAALRAGPVTTHAQAYRRHPGFSLGAVCDPRPDRLARFVSDWGVPRGYSTLDALLGAERPQVVSVCSPTPQHYADIAALLAAPATRVVFAEKPVCDSPEQLQALQALAAKRPDVAVLVNHTRRFDPAHQRAAAIIRSGALGALVHGRCDYYGGWLNNGSHLVDTLRMLVGEVTVDRVSPGAQPRDADACPNVRLLSSAAPIDVFAFDESHYQIFEIDLRFSNGRVALRNFGEDVHVERSGVNAIGERCLEPVDGAPWPGLQDPLLHAIGAIAAHERGGASLAATGATLPDAAKTMGVIWQALVPK
jgi:predicted dehydrogenase